MSVDDCHKTFEELSAKGVAFLQEPSDRPYRVEAVMRDNTGNWRYWSSPANSHLKTSNSYYRIVEPGVILK